MKNNGFSIIELIVTTGIIALVSSFVFAGYRQMGTTTLLEDEVNTIISGIEDARATALSATAITDEVGDQVEYFTILIKEDRYILFNDASEDQKEEYLFEKNVKGVNIDQIEGEESGRAIGFRPPEPEVVFLDGDLETEILDNQKYIEFKFNFGDDRGEEDITLRVNRAGLIQIIDE